MVKVEAQESSRVVELEAPVLYLARSKLVVMKEVAEAVRPQQAPWEAVAVLGLALVELRLVMEAEEALDHDWAAQVAHSAVLQTAVARQTSAL